jgi:hypothetical protein
MAAISVTACRNTQFLEVFTELRRRGGIASPFRRLKQDGRNAPKPNVCGDARALAGTSGTQISGAGAGCPFSENSPGDLRDVSDRGLFGSRMAPRARKLWIAVRMYA